jgi:hypothetical protein
MEAWHGAVVQVRRVCPEAIEWACPDVEPWLSAFPGLDEIDRFSWTEWCKTFPTFPTFPVVPREGGKVGNVGNVRAQLPALRLTEPGTSWLVCVLQRGSPLERNPKRPRIACMTATCRWSVALRSACISQHAANVKKRGATPAAPGDVAAAACMGRSHGGLTTKIHAVVDANSNPGRCRLTQNAAVLHKRHARDALPHWHTELWKCKSET